MNNLGFVAATALVASIAAPAAATTNFAGSFSVNSYTGNNGLEVKTANYANLNFNLNEGGTKSFNRLFTVYTDEGSVNAGEDTTPRSLTLNFAFTSPSGLNGSAGGTTVGYFSYVFPIFVFQGGQLTWANNGETSFTFSNGDVLSLKLFGTTFNQGLYGLNEGVRNGGNVAANFTYTRAVAPAVPEPTTWALLMTGFGLVGYSMRRRSVKFNALAA